MVLPRVRDFGKLFLTLWLYLMFALCSSTQDGREAGRYVTITNIGIKMCQARCVEQGGCVSFEYNFKSLICRLPRCNTYLTEESGSRFLLKNQTEVFTGACESMSCRLGLQCLRTRSGLAVCVKGGKQFSSGRCQKGSKKIGDVNNQLHAACCKGDMCQVRNILAEGEVDINSRTGKYNRTPVMAAAYEGHGHVFDFLVSKGCDLSHVDNMGNNILHMACNGGDLATVRYILSQGNVDVDSREQKGRTPLMIAALTGNKDVFDLLVDRGGNISKIDSERNNMLHLACSGGHTEIVEYLLSQTIIDINSKQCYGRTPLMAAAYYGHKHVFELLVDRGADVSLRDANGDNILHKASSGGHFEMVKYVLSLNKLDINSKGRYGRTPLMVATYYGHKTVFKLLMERGGDVSLRDANGDNILYKACSGGHFEMVKYVLSLNKLDINSKGCYGRTPLMAAAYYGHKHVFELLVDRGGDVSLRDANGDNILHKACSGGHFEMVKYVLSLNKLDIISKGRYGRTPLMAAAYFGHKHVFELLMDRGGDVSLRDANGNNILHKACSGGHFEMVKYVLSLNKLDINSKGRYGRTPLMAAAYSGHEKVFEILVDRGGDVSLVDTNGDNILNIACSGGHFKMVKYLLSQDMGDINRVKGNRCTMRYGELTGLCCQTP